MPELRFPEGFLWGTATSGHQVEGDNVHSDWWAWENMPGSPVREPSGRACEHFWRYPADVRLLAELGLNTYRFSVEWSRVEPEDRMIETSALAHYRDVVEAVRAAGMTPVVTLNHFTLPAWLGRRGGWLNPRAPERFASYCARVVEFLGDRVDWYATINESASVAFGGYLGALDFPPGRKDLRSWERANQALVAAHQAAREAIHGVRPQARVGQTFTITEWAASGGGVPVVEYLRAMMEDVFVEASADDDWVGVQSYTREHLAAPAVLEPVLRRALASGLVRRLVVPPAVRVATRGFGGPRRMAPGTRTTLMGYEYRPEAIGAAVRRVAELLPGKPILITEHGVATKDDAERVEYISRGLATVRECLDDGLPVLGYLHWSAFDNFEWALGYRPTFGLIGVDRQTQERIVRPSARFLGEIARSGVLALPGDS